MRREIIKALVGFGLLAVILGWMFIVYRHVLRPDRDHGYEIQRRYWQERMEITSARDAAVAEPPAELPVAAAPETTTPVPRLAVHGRVLDPRGAMVEGAVLEALADTGIRAALAPDGPWQTAALEHVGDVTLSIPSRALATAPVPMEGTEAWLRCNWTLAGATPGPLELQDAACIESGRALRIDFRGRADLPDDAVLSVALYLGQRRLYAAEYTVHATRFSGVLAPEERGFPSALYTVRVEFSVLVQPPEVRESIADNTFYETQLGVYIGDPALTARESADEFFEYWAIHRRTAHLVRVFRHLRNAGLASKDMPVEVSASLARVFPGETPEVSDGETFDVHAWRYWMDTRFVPRLEEYAAVLDARRVPLAPENSMLVDGYLRTVRRWMRVVSLRVYENAGLEYAFEDLEQIGLTPEDEEAMLAEKLAAFDARLAALHSLKRGRVPAAGIERVTVTHGDRSWRLVASGGWQVEGDAAVPPPAVMHAALGFICEPVCLYVDAHPPPALGLAAQEAPMEFELEGDLGLFPHRRLRVGARLGADMDLWYAQLDTDRAVFVCDCSALIALVEALADAPGS